MNSILKSFFYRNFKTPGFWIQFAIFGVLGLAVGLIAFAISRNAYNMYQQYPEYWYEAEYKAISFETVSLLAINGGVLSSYMTFPHIPLAVALILFSIRFHAEYESGSMRNYIVSGYSRQQAYRSLFVGFFIYSGLLYLSFALTTVVVAALGQLYWNFVDAADFLRYLAVIGLSIVMFVAHYCFAFFINTALAGRGFAGPLCILIYVGLCLIGLGMDIFVTLAYGMFSNPDKAEQAHRTVALIQMFLPSGQAGVLGSGILNRLPSSLLAYFSPEETDYTAFNVVVILLENAGIGVGSFFLGQTIIKRRDMK